MVRHRHGFARVFTGKMSFDAMGGPMTLFRRGEERRRRAAMVFLANMAIISVNLGLVNLLPIPILDGFALLAALWEGIRRRPIPMRSASTRTWSAW